MPRVEFPSFLDKEETLRSQRRHEAMMKNLWKAYQLLLEKYPDQWILWDGERVIHAGDTGKELLRYIDDNNVDTNHMKIDHLETNPTRMIL